MSSLPYIVAISGPTSAGKTYFANRLLELADVQGIKSERISTDSFYKDLSHISMKERTKINYDDPNSINSDEFEKVIKNLQHNKECKLPVYDFATHTRTDEKATVNPEKLIIVEGIFTLSYQSIVDLYDLIIYVDLDPDLRLIRRVKRDIQERGRSVESVLDQYIETVRPTQEEHVSQDKEKADIILKGNKDHKKVINLILNNVKFLSKSVT